MEWIKHLTKMELNYIIKHYRLSVIHRCCSGICNTTQRRLSLMGTVLAVLALGTGLLIIFSVVVVVMSVVRGWVLSWLWLWFAVPIFHLPPLSIVQAIGIALVVEFLTGSSVSFVKQEDDEEKKRNALVAAVLNPFVVLIFGYIVHLFM